jgi:hypothetical protein
MMASNKPTDRKQEGSFHASRIEKLARKAGYSVEKLHVLWVAGKSGDTAADIRIQRLFAKHAALSEVFDVFARAHDPRQRGALRRELLRSKPTTTPDTLWSSAKAKWVSVVAGGLPTLGKRR